MLDNIPMTREIEPPRLVLLLRTVSLIRVTRVFIGVHCLTISGANTDVFVGDLKDRLSFFTFLCIAFTHLAKNFACWIAFLTSLSCLWSSSASLLDSLAGDTEAK